MFFGATKEIIQSHLMQMRVEFIFRQQGFVEHFYCVTKIVLGAKRYVDLLYRILQSVTVLGLEILFSKQQEVGKRGQN